VLGPTPAQAADQPGQDGLHLPEFGAQQQDGGSDRPHEGIDGHASQQQGGDLCAPVDQGEGVDDGHGDHAADKGCQGQRPQAPGGQAAGQGDHRAQPAPGADADDARIGQRIAEDTLHRRAGDGQRRADKRADQGAGQADHDHDANLGVGELAHAGDAQPGQQDAGDIPGRNGR